jgi:hypothetical protein
MGMCIFNLGKIQQLYYELGTFEEKTTDGFRHVAHVLQENSGSLFSRIFNVYTFHDLSNYDKSGPT